MKIKINCTYKAGLSVILLKILTATQAEFMNKNCRNN